MFAMCFSVKLPAPSITHSGRLEERTDQKDATEYCRDHGFGFGKVESVSQPDRNKGRDRNKRVM